MATVILINTVGTQPAGSKFDTVNESALIAQLTASGGVFVDDSTIYNIAVEAAQKAIKRGNSEIADLFMGSVVAKRSLDVGDWYTVNAIHVNKSGNDENTGGNPGNAFLTIGAAIAAAVSRTPGPNNRIAIYIDDAASYTEDLTVPEWVGVIGDSALIHGKHTVSDNSLLQSFRLTYDAADTCVSKLAGTGVATIVCPRMVLTNGANGVLCTSGSLNYSGNSLEVENGFGVGSLSTGDVNVCIEAIYITGAGIGIGIASTGGLDFKGASITDAGAGTAIFISSTGTVHAHVNHIEANTLCNVGVNASLYVIAAYTSGARVGAGKRFVTTAGNIGKRSLTVGHANLTEVANGTPQSFNIGDVLPANAYIIGRTLRNITQFTGGGLTVVGLDVGGTTPNAIIASEDLTAGPTTAREGASGWNPTGYLGGQQLVAKFTPNAANNLAQATAGAVTIEVTYAVIVS